MNPDNPYFGFQNIVAALWVFFLMTIPLWILESLAKWGEGPAIQATQIFTVGTICMIGLLTIAATILFAAIVKK